MHICTTLKEYEVWRGSAVSGRRIAAQWFRRDCLLAFGKAFQWSSTRLKSGGNSFCSEEAHYKSMHCKDSLLAETYTGKSLCLSRLHCFFIVLNQQKYSVRKRKSKGENVNRMCCIKQMSFLCARCYWWLWFSMTLGWDSMAKYTAKKRNMHKNGARLYGISY